MNSRKTKLTVTILTLSLGLILSFLSLSLNYPTTNASFPTVSTITQKQIPEPKPKLVTKPSLLSSMHFYDKMVENGKMTSRDMYEYRLAISKAKVRYPKVPSTLILSTSDTESSMNPHAVHSNKNDHGMCGINYKYWGKELKEAGIIKCEKDLNKISCNVMACAFVYNYFLSETNGRVKSAILMYKGTNKDGRVDKLYCLYKSDVRKVFLTQKG